MKNKGCQSACWLKERETGYQGSLIKFIWFWGSQFFDHICTLQVKQISQGTTFLLLGKVYISVKRICLSVSLSLCCRVKFVFCVVAVTEYPDSYCILTPAFGWVRIYAVWITWLEGKSLRKNVCCWDGFVCLKNMRVDRLSGAPGLVWWKRVSESRLEQELTHF